MRCLTPCVAPDWLLSQATAILGSSVVSPCQKQLSQLGLLTVPLTEGWGDSQDPHLSIQHLPTTLHACNSALIACDLVRG